MSTLKPGDRISNYLLAEKLGTGSFGEVWKARHHVFNDEVAIKIPTDPQYVRHLQREGMAVHGLRDGNIVRAIDLDPYADVPYLVMELVDGPSVRKLLEENPQGLSIEQALAILWGVLSALKVAHGANVIHRDIKPANILIAGRDDLEHLTPDRVKVTDFGLGHVTDATAGSIMQSGSMVTETGRHIAGTIAYMAPEQRDGREIDARSDLYSVGVVLHEMLTGTLPQGSDLPSAIRPGVHRWIDKLFERCYTRYERRFASAAEMLEEIRRYWSAPMSAAMATAMPVSNQKPRIQHVGGTWKCGSCGGYVRRGSQFCIHCGWQLVEHVPRCPTCHWYVGQDDNFCTNCGAELGVAR